MKRVRTILKWLVIVLACLFIIIQIRRPARTNPPVDQSQTIEAHTEITPQVASILARSCNDCHSNKTVWPWYTNVAPVSWFVIDHVNEGRSNLSLSEWGRNDQRRQGKKLEQMCDEVKDGAMPLSSYTPLHPGSKLSAEDVKTLCDWTEAERARLAAQ
ncbi:MAG: heme-binding domain-containing protein [Pyrinomonadaceae bacterium]